MKLPDMWNDLKCLILGHNWVFAYRIGGIYAVKAYYCVKCNRWEARK